MKRPSTLQKMIFHEIVLNTVVLSFQKKISFMKWS